MEPADTSSLVLRCCVLQAVAGGWSSRLQDWLSVAAAVAGKDCCSAAAMTTAMQADSSRRRIKLRFSLRKH
jgi:hypothetical protein